MNKKISLGITISLVVIACAVTYILATNLSLDLYNDKYSNLNERQEIYDKLDEIDNYVREEYINNVDQDKLNDAVAMGYMSILDDKYAVYRSKEEYEKFKQSNQGLIVGIGVTVSQDYSGYIYVDDVDENSPAKLVGDMQVGDLIVNVDGESVLSVGYSDAIKMLAGDEGTTVTITVRRNGEDKDIILTRTQLTMQTVTYHAIDDILYIKVSKFNTATVDQFNNALAELDNADYNGIIIDLRNNGGGLLDTCLKMCDRMLPECDIATAVYKNNVQSVLGTSDADYINLPVAIVTNSMTASASELFASALRDNVNAIIVGETTYGKGVMQKTFDLSDGSAITFTIAKYATSKTPNFDGVGLKPDYEVIVEDDTDQDIMNMISSTDTQLLKAVEVLEAKIQ